MVALILRWPTALAVVAAFLCLPALVFAQGGAVKGMVLEAGLDEPLPGVNVYLEGTRLGAARPGLLQAPSL